MTDKLRKHVLAANGKIPFDQLVIHAKLIEVYIGRVIEDASVGICDGIVVSVCPSFEAEAEEIIDCQGSYLSPSFIDAHMHIESSRLTPYAYCEGAVPHGTGCIMTDPMQLVNAAGEAGLVAFCEMLQELPLRSYLQFPSRVPAAEGMEHSGAFFSPEDTKRLMQQSASLTLGEVNVLELMRDSTLQKLAEAREEKRPVNGHCPNATHDQLCAAVSAGIRDDHESETYEELLDRLSVGMDVMVRQGTIEPNCQTLISGVVKHQMPTEHLMFCTDDKRPEDIQKNGCIDYAIRIAINCGLEPVKAIQMATVNAARHFGMENKIGVIAPGRYADFLLFDRLERIEVKKVYLGGKLVAENGRLLTRQKINLKETYPGLFHTVVLPENLTGEKLATRVSASVKKVQAVVIEMLENSLLTRKYMADVCVKDGLLQPDLERDILPIAVVDRFSGELHIGTSMIKGLQIKRGAIASSTAQEGNNIVVSGTNYSDMLLAVKEVAACGGGNVICINGKIAAVRKLPIAGILGSGSLQEELRAAKKFQEALSETGSQNMQLMAALTVSLCPSIPQIGLTDMGLIEQGKRISPVSEGESLYETDNGDKSD